MLPDMFTEEFYKIISRGTRRRRSKRFIRRYWVNFNRAHSATNISEEEFVREYNKKAKYWSDSRASRTFYADYIIVEGDRYWVSVHINHTARRGTLRVGRFHRDQRKDCYECLRVLRMPRSMCATLLRRLHSADADMLEDFVRHMIGAVSLKIRLKIWLNVNITK